MAKPLAHATNCDSHNTKQHECSHIAGMTVVGESDTARILGYEVGELIETPMRDLVAPECREGFDRYLERIKSTGADQGTLCVVYGSCTRTAPAARFDCEGARV